MFGIFKKKKKGGGDEPPQNDEAEFIQAVVNKFVTMVDEFADNNPDIPAFRDRWTFQIDEINSWMQSETMGQMSCRITAKDAHGVFPDFSEWAHGWGEGIDGAFNTGFSNWITTDLPVLIDVIQDSAVLSQELSYKHPDSGRDIRAILGPMQFWSKGDDGPEPCCNSCIYTQVLSATDGEFNKMNPPYLIKAVVIRHPDKTTEADFRIADMQDETIAAHLSNWAMTWEGEGFAMRKQSLLFVEA